MKNRELVTGGNGGLRETGAPGPPPEWLLAHLWPVLERQALLYTGGDSTSLPLETVQRLFDSLLFCIRVAGENAPRESRDPAALLLTGQRVLYRETEAGKRLLSKTRALAPRGSGTMWETLDGCGEFFKVYDIRFFAHEIPGMIDYPLCIPVPDENLGIHYINKYLQSLLWESQFCHCFENQPFLKLLDTCRPEWRELPYNLCAALFASALGLAIVGGEMAALHYGEEEYKRLSHTLLDTGEEAVRKAIERGSAGVLNKARLWNTGLRAYFTAYAETLVPLVCAADGKGLRNLFPSL